MNRPQIIFALLLTFFSVNLQAEPVPAAAVQAMPKVETYDELLRAVRQVRAESQKRIEEAVERENVREAWETGKLIDTHVLYHKERADYGKQVISKLAKDLGSSPTELRYMLEFARTYPIYPSTGKLSWSHYRELLSVNDTEQRKTLIEQAEKEAWTEQRIRQAVRDSKSKSEEGVTETKTLTAQPGKVGTYRIVKATVGPLSGQLVLDLGFSNYYAPPQKLKFKDRDIVSLNKGKLKKAKDVSEKDLFTYKAYVIKVLDGDTFSAVIDLGFGFNSVQTLRLRGLDAPELPSKEGQEAKEFLDSRLKRSGMTEGKASPVLIRTVKSDKYDRYLVDVWSSAETISKSSREALGSSGTRVHGEYVNQELVERGLAFVVED